MIQDILLSCLNLNSDALNKFVVSDAVSAYIHPCERNMIKEILAIVSLSRKVANFSLINGTQKFFNLNASTQETEEPMQNGLYLNAFANGLANVLDEYKTFIADLEEQFLKDSSPSIMFICYQIQEYEPLARYLSILIRGVSSQRLHGCAILQHLQQHSLHGDARIVKTIKVIRTSITVVFLKQLTDWLMNGKITDTYGEFFIQPAECKGGGASGGGDGDGGASTYAPTYSDTSSNYHDVWSYEICYGLLPKSFSSRWAEKVLFIGQTVLTFKAEMERQEKDAPKNSNALQQESFWNGGEQIYYEKIQKLLNDDMLHVPRYECLINEMKTQVTRRLANILMNQGDFVNQLKLLKNYFLLGKGELFLEFIRLTNDINKDIANTSKLRDFVKAFELAARAIGISKEMENFTLSLAETYDLCEESNDFGYFRFLELDYKMNWPLHLIMTPKVLERYNKLFRFLLLTKKVQYELQMAWMKSTTKKKSGAIQNMKAIQLPNELILFVDNLQYYIQVDVFESEFSLLLNAIINQADFNEIQKAHNDFLTKILTLCFLLPEEGVVDTTNSPTSFSTSKPVTNPVYKIIIEVFQIVNAFCLFVDENSEKYLDCDHVDSLDQRFGQLMRELMKLRDGFETVNCTRALYQFILRLDLNQLFSNLKIQTDN